MDSSSITAVSATGDITTQQAHLRNVVLTAGSDAATVVVRRGGAAGTIVLTLKAAANTTADSGPLCDAFCPGGVHVTVTGTAPAVTVVYV